MKILILRFLNAFFALILTGIVVGIWLGSDPKTLSSNAYIESQQDMIACLNVLMPLLGLVTILITLTSAYLQRSNKTTRWILAIAAFFFICSGIVTRFGNQPINAVVMTFDGAHPPADWWKLRDNWWQLHILRTILMFVGSTLILWINTWGSRSATSSD